MSLFTSLKKQYFRMCFSSSWFAITFNPYWLARREMALNLPTLASRLSGRVLDFGSGSQPYRPLLVNCSSYTSCEIDTPENRKNNLTSIFYQGEEIPVADNSFDSIISTETLEHVYNPDFIVAEWARILKKMVY